jgi:hypothetical protein
VEFAVVVSRFCDVIVRSAIQLSVRAAHINV